MGLPDVVDVIVAGGGPAGCAVAGRLARADPNLQVLLVEAGPNNKEDPTVYTPGVYPRNMRILDSDKAKFYYDTNPSEHLRGRRSIVPCAQVLGGGSSINFQMYTRASASDWDDFKMPGWSAKELLPIMKRIECYQKPANNDTHGFDGPVAISNGGWIAPIAQDFLRASAAVGIPTTDDLQDLNTSHAAEIWAKWINKDTGRRSDAASAYIHPVMVGQTNLHLAVNSKASRVIFEGTKAVGLAFVNTKPNHGGKETIVRARKMVVLTSGTLGTPQILERSGIGGKDVLDKAGVKTLVDLPGVGKQYQDHYTTFSVFRARQSEPTIDDWLRGDPATHEKLTLQYQLTKSGPLASNAIDAGFKIRPTEQELEDMGPEFRKSWDAYFKDKPDKPLVFGSIVNGHFGDHSLVPPGKYFSMFQYLEYPFSRGSIHIKSANPYEDPNFDSGFLNHPADIPPIRWSYKKVREIARRMDAYRGELTSCHPHFHPASPAAAEDVDLETAREILGPLALTNGIHMGTWSRPSKHEPHKVREDLKYTKEDDEAIDNWVRDHVETTWHSLGTCAMKPREQEGVLDARLNVYGTSNLKVGDLSLCPDNLGTNTYSSALLCGEKCADLIAEELGLTIQNPQAVKARYVPI
ncbi:putative methanol oxidase [Auricularia subglabra TFB-10046 SS5]|nr:putative methanol oxidase [Auricularia subglabra TFB-10046 SS5]